MVSTKFLLVARAGSGEGRWVLSHIAWDYVRAILPFRVFLRLRQCPDVRLGRRGWGVFVDRGGKISMGPVGKQNLPCKKPVPSKSRSAQFKLLTKHLEGRLPADFHLLLAVLTAPERCSNLCADLGSFQRRTVINDRYSQSRTDPFRNTAQ